MPLSNKKGRKVKDGQMQSRQRKVYLWCCMDVVARYSLSLGASLGNGLLALL